MTQLNIFRIKRGLNDPDQILQGRDGLWSKDIRVGNSLLGVLYVERSFPKPPRWLTYFESVVDFSEISLLTASSSAILLVPKPNNLFAIVFGYGRYLLAEAAIESRFGLRVTLNAIEPSQLRSIDHKRLEGVPRHTREQVTKASGLEEFGLDVERDLLRGVTGTPKDQSLGIRLSGADQLVVVGNLPLTTLSNQLDRYAKLAVEETYKESFAWVDTIAEVTDPVLRTRLDVELIRELVIDSTAFWLAVPEIVDWTSIEGFRYDRGKAAPTHDDLDLKEYLAERRTRRDVTAAALREDHVRSIRAEDGSEQQSWSIYRCLVGDFTLGDARFVLSEGKWYRIDPIFVAVIDADINAMLPTSAVLPVCKEKLESDYNSRAARRSKGDLILLDQDFVQYGSRGKIEVCDLYSRKRIFIHVKHAGASSVLSHLFSQGLVSATLMLNETGFRKALFAKLPESHRWGDPDLPLNSRDFEVAYAVIAKPGRTLNLPFFSKVNLRNATRTLKAFGFRVSLTAVTSTFGRDGKTTFGIG